MKFWSKKSAVLLACLSLALGLAACTPKEAPASSSSQPSSSTSGISSMPAKEQSISGTLYSVDEELGYLVLTTDDSYERFALNKVDVTGFEPGDDVKLTYTGTLDSEGEDISAVLVSIEKTSEA